MFGTSRPSTKMPEPTPVPRVSTITTPRLPWPAPKRISATPAASASLTTQVRRLNALLKAAWASKPIQSGSTLAAVLVTPLITGAGKPTPIAWITGTGCPAAAAAEFAARIRRPTTRPAEATTTPGLDGIGVRTRIRSPTSSPVLTSTTAALIPVPPTSTPIASSGSCISCLHDQK